MFLSFSVIGLPFEVKVDNAVFHWLCEQNLQKKAEFLATYGGEIVTWMKLLKDLGGIYKKNGRRYVC